MKTNLCALSLTTAGADPTNKYRVYIPIVFSSTNHNLQVEDYN